MANEDVTLVWDDAALADMLNGPTGLVAPFIFELSVQAAAVATALVHVRPGTPASARTGRRSDARPPGYTRSRISPHLAWGAQSGDVYGGVNSPMDPTVFLEKPADQIERKEGHGFPFITTALWSLEGTF